MVSVCLPSDALLQHLPSYLGFSYLGHGISLHGYSSKAQPLLLTLDEEYLLTATVPDLQCGIAPLGPPVPAQPPLLGLLLPAAGPGLGHGWLLPTVALGLGLRVALRVTTPDLGHGVSPPSRHWPWTWGSSSLPPPLTSDVGCLLLAATGLGHWIVPPGHCPDLRLRVAPPSRSCTVTAWHSGPLPLTSDMG